MNRTGGNPNWVHVRDAGWRDYIELGGNADDVWAVFDETYKLTEDEVHEQLNYYSSWFGAVTHET